MILTRRKRAVAWLLVPGGLVTLLFLSQVEDRAKGPFEVCPVSRAELRAPVAGFLREVFFDEGERVYPGTLVARLEIPDLDSRLARKQAEVRESKARLRLLRVGPRPEEVDEQRGRVARARAWRDLAQRDLARADKALRQELASLAKLIEQHQAERNYARLVLARSRKLMVRRALADEQYEETAKEAQVSRARQQQTQARRQALQERGTQQAEEELARREKELADAQAVLRLLLAGTRPEELEAEQARLARLQEEVRYLQTVQRRLPVRSPVGGLVTTPRLKDKLGRYFQEGELICEIEKPEELEAEVALEELDVARVQLGQAVELKARGLPFQTFQAQVTRIAPRATRAEAAATAAKPARGELPGTVTVYCRLQGTDEGLRPGMTGHARINCGRRVAAELWTERVLRFLRTEFWW
jgi:multidrug resistance efflux pump